MDVRRGSLSAGRTSEISRATAGSPPVPGASLGRPRAVCHSRRLLPCRRALSGIPDGPGDLPPYTQLSTPVYSLSSCAADGSRRTLNIVTYASPIAIKPTRKYVVGLYVGTLSWENVRETGRCVLQILQQSHSPLIPLLGKRSGRDVDKLQEATQLGFKLDEAFGLPVLADHAGVMELRTVSEFMPCGDHEVVICDVTGWRDAAEGPSAPLYTSYLKKTGFL